MSTRSLLALATLPVVVAGLAISAFAQHESTALDEQALAAVDRMLVELAFTRADASGDGKLTREEASGQPAVAARFDSLDQDGDSRLSLEEFAAGVITPG